MPSGKGVVMRPKLNPACLSSERSAIEEKHQQFGSSKGHREPAGSSGQYPLNLD